MYEEQVRRLRDKASKLDYDELINYYWIKQWDGKLPSTVLGGDNSFMIDLTN